MGLDAQDVLSLTLHCEAGELPTVTLKKAVYSGLDEKADGILERYSVRLIDAAPLAITGECVDLSLQTHTSRLQAG